jgi:hypothetical protein
VWPVEGFGDLGWGRCRRSVLPMPGHRQLSFTLGCGWWRDRRIGVSRRHLYTSGFGANTFGPVPSCSTAQRAAFPVPGESGEFCEAATSVNRQPYGRGDREILVEEDQWA